MKVVLVAGAFDTLCQPALSCDRWLLRSRGAGHPPRSAPGNRSAKHSVTRRDLPYSERNWPQVRPLDAAAKDNKAKRLAGQLRALGFEVKLERAA